MQEVSRARLVGLLDNLALLAVLAGIAIHAAGGFALAVGEMTLSARRWERPLVFALAIVLLRLLVDRTTPPPAAWRRFRNRTYHPLADEHGSVSSIPWWQAHGLALTAFCAFGVTMLWFQISHLDAIPDIGDPLFSVWRVSWVYRQILGDPRDLFDANIFFPLPLTLSYSDSMLLPALTVMPLLAAGAHPVVATNAILVLSFMASAFTMYLLVGRLTGSRLSGFIAGLLFGFYPYRFDHYHHFELLMTYWLPLVLLAMHRFFDSLRIRDAVLTAVVAVAQLYSSMYLAVLLMWQVLGMSAVLLGLTRPRLQRLIVPALAAGTLAIVLASPLVSTYSSADLEERSEKELALYSAEARDYLQPHPRSAFWGAGSEPWVERALFPGIMAIALAVIGVTRRLGRIRVVYLVGLVIAFELSLGVNGYVYPHLYEWLGFMRGLRAPARAGFLFGLALAVLAGFGVQRLLAGRSLSTSLAMVGVLTVAIGADLRPAVEITPAWPAPPRVYDSITPTDVLAEFPMGSLTEDTGLMMDTPYMYFSTWHGAQLINGYSGHLPPDHFDFIRAMEAFPDPDTLRVLRERGTTHVSLNCRFYRGCGRLIERLERTPDLRLVASDTWDERPVHLYELLPKR